MMIDRLLEQPLTVMCPDCYAMGIGIFANAQDFLDYLRALFEQVLQSSDEDAKAAIREQVPDVMVTNTLQTVREALERDGLVQARCSVCRLDDTMRNYEIQGRKDAVRVSPYLILEKAFYKRLKKEDPDELVRIRSWRPRW